MGGDRGPTQAQPAAPILVDVCGLIERGADTEWVTVVSGRSSSETNGGTAPGCQRTRRRTGQRRTVANGPCPSACDISKRCDRRIAMLRYVEVSSPPLESGRPGSRWAGLVAPAPSRGRPAGCDKTLFLTWEAAPFSGAVVNLVHISFHVVKSPVNKFVPGLSSLELHWRIPVDFRPPSTREGIVGFLAEHPEPPQL